MKKRHLLSAIMCVVLSLAMSLTTYAQTYVGGGETRRVKQHEDFIQRIYNKGGLVFTYSHDITFHYDTNHVVTTRVEHGEDLVSYANTMATSQGINVSSYKPNSSACGSATWQLAGWKIGNDAANDADLLTTAPSNSNVDLYAVWKKDCTSTINWNGGSGSGGNLSGFAYYNNGNVTPFSCTLPTSAVRANYTFTDFSGYRAGQTVQLLDKSTFICNWKAENIYKIWTGVWCEGAWNPVISGNNISVTQVGGKYYNNALFIRTVDGSPITSISYDVAFTGNAGGMFIPDGDTSRMACTEAQWGGHVSWAGSCNYIYLDYCGNPGTSAYWTNFYINGKPASFTW